MFSSAITHHNGNRTLSGIPYGVDFWESAPLLDDFNGEAIETPLPFTTVVADLIGIKTTDVQLRRRGDELLFSFQICESRVGLFTCLLQERTFSTHKWKFFVLFIGKFYGSWGKSLPFISKMFCFQSHQQENLIFWLERMEIGSN